MTHDLARIEGTPIALAPIESGWVLAYFSSTGFSSSLGILIGALGASFEEQRHFRHLALVDEET